jgi:outer membrane protein OmpA-like peptidoglycan-associated protein
MPGLLALFLCLAGCGANSPIQTPVSWWHDLAGGEIAANRPPPPGADLPYPHIYSIPPKPVPPSDSFRRTVETQLAQERDDTQRLAARHPIVVETVPPPPKPVAPPPPQTDASANPPPNSSADSSADPPADAAAGIASATLPGADAPPPHSAKATAAAAQPQQAPDGGPLPGAPLTIAGLPAQDPNLPVIPDAPPPPATFEGVPAEPAPTPPPPLPAHVPLSAQGTAIYFAPASAELNVSQNITIKDVAFRRGKATLDVEGHGEAASDSPTGQEAALALALKRAQAVAHALESQRVPPAAIRISATAFGLGASLKPAS